jgi:phosphoglycolate phosphatase
MGPREALRAQGVPLLALPRLASRVRERLRARMPVVRAFEGIEAALHALRAAGCRTGILTSNARENVEAFLGQHALPPFDHVSCGASLFGKPALLRSLIERAGADPPESVYVGDEVRDIAAAKAAGARSIAVTWGYAHRDALAAQAPDHLVEAPADLAAACLRR